MFHPTTSDPAGPGTDGHVMYPSRAAYETHRWFSMTSMIMGGAGAALGAALGTAAADSSAPTAKAAPVALATLGAIAGVWLGNRTPPA